MSPASQTAAPGRVRQVLSCMRPESLWWGLLTILLLAPSAFAGELAVLVSSDALRSQNIYRGLAAELTPEHTLKEYPIGDDAGARDVVARVLSSKPALIFTVGTQSALLARELIRDVPVVFTMAVDNPTFNFHTSNMTGVDGDLPVRQRFELLRELDPGLKRVGVIYNPNNAAHLVNESYNIAQELGLEIVAGKIDVKQDIPRATRALQGKIDLLWMVRDPALLDPEALRELLKFSLLEKVPLLTFSETLVKAGAVLAITPAEEGMGRQAARIGKQILAGKRPGQIDVQSPTAFEIALNLATAKRIGRLEDLAINVLVYAAEQKQSIQVFR